MRDESQDIRAELGGASLLRAAADGELTGDEQARLDAHLAGHPEDASRIAFERELRSCCRRVLGGERCPEALRERVRAIAAGQLDEAMREGLAARAEQTRDRSFWSGSRVVGLIAAAAAVVALTSTAVVLVRTPQPGAGPGIGQLQYAEFRDEVTRFVADEHDRCWVNEDVAEAKFKTKDPEAVAAEFESMLGNRIDLPVWHQPTQGLVFIGAGPCHVPGSGGKSAHLRFDIPETADRPATGVSLFIAPNTGELPVKPGTTYAVDTKACGAGGSSVLVWVENGMLFFLVADAQAGGCDKLRAALGVPEATDGL